MSHFNDDILRSQLDPGPLPEQAQQKLNRIYGMLDAVPQAKPVRPVRLRWRRAAALAVAAVLALAGGTVALAATGGLMPMVQGIISFFNGSQTTNLDSLQPVFEAHNAAVEQSVTDQDITFTVENVSVDAGFVNIFGRITTGESIGALARRQNQISAVDAEGNIGEPQPYYTYGLPSWNLVRAVGAMPVVRVNGQIYGFDNTLSDSMNAYLEDDHTLVFARRILVPDGLPDTFTMEILPHYYTDENGEHQSLMNHEGDWTISVEVDATAAREAVKTLAAGEIPLGDAGRLDLKHFRWSPLGTLVSADEHVEAVPGTGTADGAFPDYAQAAGYLGLDRVAIRDDQGNWLYPMIPAGYDSGADHVAEYTSPAQGTRSITFVPASLSGGGEEKTVLAQPGQKIELGKDYGYVIERIETAAQTLTITLTPYGPRTAGSVGLEVFPCGAGGQSLDGNDRMAYEAVTDHITGAVTLEYYFDMEGEPQGLEQLRYFTWGDLTLDEANAVTLLLK